MRPDGVIYFLVVTVVILSGTLTVHTLDPLCRYRRGGCTVLETVSYRSLISLGGLASSYVLLRRQVLSLDPESIRLRTGRRGKLIRWKDMSLIAEFSQKGRRYPPAIVIEHGVGRLFHIYDSTRISGKDLFRAIDHYVTRHAIKVATKAA